MRKLNIYKTIQLCIFILMTIVCVIMLVVDPEVFNSVASDSSLRILCGLLWATLAMSFLFLFFDFSFFSSFKRNYNELEDQAHIDYVTGLPNRQVCDSRIHKYAGKALPKDFSSCVIRLTNINGINDEYGLQIGTQALHDFAQILSASTVGLGFVGRNGGDNFLILFHATTKETISVFRSRIEAKIQNYNQQNSNPKVEYSIGIAGCGSDHVDDINKLVVLADERSRL